MIYSKNMITIKKNEKTVAQDTFSGYMMGDNNSSFTPNDISLIDIYGEELLDIDWNSYYEYIYICDTDQVSPLDIAPSWFHELKHDKGLEDVQMLYVGGDMGTAIFPEESQIQIPADWEATLLYIFLSSGLGRPIGTYVQNELTVKANEGDPKLMPESYYFHFIRDEREDPGEAEFNKASKIIADDVQNYDLLP